jgi:hypothetical protein
MSETFKILIALHNIAFETKWLRCYLSKVCVLCVTKVSFHHRGQEFIRVGYYVNNDYGDPELRETQPPSAPQFDKLQRNILATNPRVTRFKVWFI